MATDPITPDTLLKALFSQRPETIPTFLQHRMSCVGCLMSGFDTLQDAARNYHLDCSQLIAELQAVIAADREAGLPGVQNHPPL